MERPSDESPKPAPKLAREFGEIDIHLFDQLLRGRIRPGLRVFDAGCGKGRNLVHLLREGYDVAGIDPKPERIDEVRALAAELQPQLDPERFQVARLEDLSEDASRHGTADVVICNAVLHFARDPEHFRAMLAGAWSMLAPGGLFFSRLGSRIGLAAAPPSKGRGRYVQPDGKTRYLVDEAELEELREHMNAELVDPLKTTVVSGKRCMSTWLLRRSAASERD